MFKVICIDDSHWEKGFDGLWRPKFGGIYNVTWVGCIFFKNGEESIGYSLAEDPENETTAWDIIRFLRLSEIDEMELINEKQLTPIKTTYS